MEIKGLMILVEDTTGKIRKVNTTSEHIVPVLDFLASLFDGTIPLLEKPVETEEIIKNA